jgi:pimeloyl-ACP methyl ester carboxylesterase
MQTFQQTQTLSRRSVLLGAAAALSSFQALAQGNTAASRSQSVMRAGARLYVETEGAGLPVLLLHGGLGHSGWFEGLRKHLVARGRQVIVLDTRGMGRSSLGEGLSYGASELDAYAVMDALNVQKSDVIGFSDGGIVGYRMASRVNSRVTRLVTIGSRFSADNGKAMWGAFDSWNRTSLSAGDFKFIVEDYDRLNPDRDFDRMMRAAAQMWKDDGINGHPGLAALERITQPVLVAVGDRDPFLVVADATVAHTKIKRSQLLVVPAATHPAYRERPEIFLPALDSFLQGALS